MNTAELEREIHEAARTLCYVSIGDPGRSLRALQDADDAHRYARAVDLSAATVLLAVRAWLRKDPRPVVAEDESVLLPFVIRSGADRADRVPPNVTVDELTKAHAMAVELYSSARDLPERVYDAWLQLAALAIRFASEQHTSSKLRSTP